MTIKTLLRLAAGLFLLAAVALLISQVIAYRSGAGVFPAGMIIAGVPAGGLRQEQAVERLVSVYDLPVEGRYNGGAFQLVPSRVGFVLDLNEMMRQAEAETGQGGFIRGLWGYIWRRQAAGVDIPLKTIVDEAQLRRYLEQEIAPRYDQPGTPAAPIPGDVIFTAGTPGSGLDVDAALPLLLSTMSSLDDRTVDLPVKVLQPAAPPLEHLEIMLRQILLVDGFDGIAEVYFSSLDGKQQVQFAQDRGQVIPADVPFTAASTIKIPIMTSLFRRIDLPLAADIEQSLRLMIDQSENTPADTLMANYIGGNLAPMSITEDMRSLGLENTFLAGFFYIGAPLLQRYETPANTRTDVSVSLDVYNQTTAADMATLLAQVYHCAENGGGLAAVFPGEVTPQECETMLAFLRNNKLPALITAGLPEGTPIAQKHGWVIEEDGLMHTIVNSGVVYSPAGDYVLSIFFYHPDQLFYDPANLLMARLSQAVYNYVQVAGDSAN